MKAVRGKDTRVELAFRRSLFAGGLRYRVHDRRVYGRPDVSFPTERIAVFVDGDFWHGNAWKVRGFESFDEQFDRWAHGDFWRKKIMRNMERDREVDAELRRRGWLVLRFWESELASDSSRATRRVVRAVARRRKLAYGSPA
jgi:DNA mismatch endonuclease (patch repair protein)